MDTVTAFAPRRQEPMPAVGVAPAPDADKTLNVTATYRLSEDGRKASLLAGGDGRALQELTLHVPTNRLHLVSVDLEGLARLKLRPRYETDGDGRVVRIDDLPTYDAPPTLEDLFKEAARNHQLAHVHEAERRAAQAKRRDTDRERRGAVAQAFLADPNQRALVHPTPTPRRCYVATATRRIAFDASTDVGPAGEVPTEAHRRFRADLRSKRERNLQERSAQLALHEEKKRVIAEWIATCGTSDQKARQEAGVLPIDEAIEAMTDQTFSTLAERPHYVQDGAERLQRLVSGLPDRTSAMITKADVVVTSSDVVRMTAAQFAIVQDVKALIPDATVTLRVHQVSWRRDPRVALPPVFGVLVTQRVEPFTFRREYAVTE